MRFSASALLFLLLVAITLVLPVSAFSPPSVGNGSESNPYVVFFDEPFHAAAFYAENYGPYYQYTEIDIVRGEPYGTVLNCVISEDASAGAYVMTVNSSGTSSDTFWLRYTQREDDGQNDYLTYVRYIYFTLGSVSDPDPSVSISTSPTGLLGVSQPYTLTFSDFPPDFETPLYFEVWYEDALVWESATTPGTNPTFVREFTPWSVGSGNLSVFVYYVEGTYDYVARAPVTVTYGSGSDPVAPPGPIPTLLPFANPVPFDREQIRNDINASVGGFPGVSGVITDYLDFSDGVIDGFSGLMLAFFSPFNSVIDDEVDNTVTVRVSYLGLYTSLSGNLEFLLWLVTSAINCLPAKVQALISFNLICDLIVLLMRGVA